MIADFFFVVLFVRAANSQVEECDTKVDNWGMLTGYMCQMRKQQSLQLQRPYRNPRQGLKEGTRTLFHPLVSASVPHYSWHGAPKDCGMQLIMGIKFQPFCATPKKKKCSRTCMLMNK